MEAPRSRSVLTDAAGIANLVFGAAFVGLALWVLLDGANLISHLFAAADAAGKLPEAGAARQAVGDGAKGLAGVLLGLLSLVAGCLGLQGLPLLLVGAGVLRRSPAARVFGILFAVLAALEAAGCFLAPRPTPALMTAGGLLACYAALGLAGLCSGRAGREFAGHFDVPGPAGDTPPPASYPIPLAVPVLASAAVSAAVTAAILYLWRPAPGPAAPGAAPTAPAVEIKPPEPFAQSGKVKAEGIEGVVFYPVPYMTPPHLEVTSAGNKYRIARQDELGFSWIVLPPKLVPDAKDLEAMRAPGDFTWAAKGMHLNGAANYPVTYEQRGAFASEGGLSGEVYFTTPFSLPPRVELAGNAKTAVTGVNALGFRWTNAAASGTTSTLERGEVKWTARGLRATAEQAASLLRELPPPRPLSAPIELFKQNGKFAFDWGLKGEVAFPHPYAHPPNIAIERVSCIVITELTAKGFKWRDRFEPERGKNYSAGPHTADWIATGIKATAIPK